MLQPKSCHDVSSEFEFHQRLGRLFVARAKIVANTTSCQATPRFDSSLLSGGCGMPCWIDPSGILPGFLFIQGCVLAWCCSVHCEQSRVQYRYHLWLSPRDTASFHAFPQTKHNLLRLISSIRTTSNRRIIPFKAF